MITARFQKYRLHFKQASGTSRGILTYKDSWFIILSENGKKGIGECGLLKGLSIDDNSWYEEEIKRVCEWINTGEKINEKELIHYPSIRFGLEMAFMDLASRRNNILFPSFFTNGKTGININGLVWMGDYKFMKKQIREKINKGFRCIKLKIGAIDFKKELTLLKEIRKDFSPDTIEIRVDANGAFSFKDALKKLERLSDFHVHSIEQPIKQGQYEEMRDLCRKSPIPIVLDEELIGIHNPSTKKTLLEILKPHYIILKPSLLGGFASSEEWIKLAEENNINWWVTSALESNIGLNAIAQWTYTLKNSLPQGLGTGQLYTNNFPSPLEIENGRLFYRPKKSWDSNNLFC